MCFSKYSTPSAVAERAESIVNTAVNKQINHVTNIGGRNFFIAWIVPRNAWRYSRKTACSLNARNIGKGAMMKSNLRLS